MRKALLPQFALLASFKAQICHLLITAWHATIFFRPNQGYRQILVTKKIFSSYCYIHGAWILLEQTQTSFHWSQSMCITNSETHGFFLPYTRLLHSY